MGRILVIWVGIALAASAPVEAAGARWRLFSRSTAGLQAVINGVPGYLDLAHFRCPLTVHVATCGVTLLLGDPFLLNILAHGSLKVMENVNWAEFRPSQWTGDARTLQRLIRDPSYNGELYRIVQLHLQEHKRRVEQHSGGASHLRSGTLNLSLYSHAEKQIPYPGVDAHPSFRHQTGRVWVTAPRVDIHSASLLLESEGDAQFYQSQYRGEPDWSLTSMSPLCAQMLLFEQG